MPKAGECVECGEPVWVTDDGACKVCSTLVAESTWYMALPVCPSDPKCPPPNRKPLQQADLVAALGAVDEAWADLVRARSVMPFLDAKAVGCVASSMPPFYRRFGLNPTVVLFERPLAAADVDRVKMAGHSINEGYVLRLYAILEVMGAFKSVLEREDPVESRILLLKDLRNEIAHGRRRFSPNDKDQKAVMCQLLASFYSDDAMHDNSDLASERASIESQRKSGEPFLWPLSIGGVLGQLNETVLGFIGARMT